MWQGYLLKNSYNLESGVVFWRNFGFIMVVTFAFSIVLWNSSKHQPITCSFCFDIQDTFESKENVLKLP